MFPAKNNDIIIMPMANFIIGFAGLGEGVIDEFLLDTAQLLGYRDPDKGGCIAISVG